MNRVKRENNLKAYLILIIGYGVSFILLSLTLRSLPMVTAYAIWTGIGTSGGALVRMLFFGESKNWRQKRTFPASIKGAGHSIDEL